VTAAALGLHARRLRAIGLDAPRWSAPEDVVRDLTAVQAQDYRPALWSVAQRLPDADGRPAPESAVDEAFQAGRLVRTHVLRPTWHFVVPEDLRWLLRLTGPRVQQTNGSIRATFGIDDATLARGERLLRAELEGGRARSRKQLEPALAAAGLPTSGVGLAYVLMTAELDGVICSGPMDGRQHTYALLEETVPPARPRTDDEALEELVRRYFTSHGPATPKDLRWWASLTLAQIARGIELAGDALRRDEVDGVTYWSGADDGALGDAPSPGEPTGGPRAALLQSYDEAVVGYAESKWLLDVSRSATDAFRDESRFNALVLVDGQVVGAWRRTLSARAARLDVRLARPLDDAERAAVAEAARRHGEFLGLGVELVTAGA
jgi:hypothetical protein